MSLELDLNLQLLLTMQMHCQLCCPDLQAIVCFDSSNYLFFGFKHKIAMENLSHWNTFLVEKLHLCELILEQEGVYGSTRLLEYPLGFIPLETDLYSLETPDFFSSFFLEGDQTWLHTAATSLIQLQKFCGPIYNVYGVGRCAKMVIDMFRVLDNETKQTGSTNSQIDYAILIDRDVDYPSVLLTQLTYEGLLDETYGIKSAKVTFGEDVTKKKESVKVVLNNSDEIFKEIRDQHISNVFSYLGNKAKTLQAKYDVCIILFNFDKKMNFVANELRGLQQQHKYLALHIGACEVIMKQKNKGNFKDHLNVEHNLLDCVELRENMNYIEETINRQLSLLGSLRLLCLLSITQNGLSPRDYKSLLTQFLHSHGHKHLLTFHYLKKLGLFMEQPSVSLPVSGPVSAGMAAAKVVAAVTSRTNSFKMVTKKLGLIPKTDEEIDLKTPVDMSYVFSGAYIPLVCKLSQQIITREGFQGMEEITKAIGKPTVTNNKARPVRGRDSITSIGSLSLENETNKVVLIYFLGGITYAEVAALRLLAKQNKYTLLIATTNMVNGNTLLQQLMPQVP
ncbi:vacuolar protein sorting-associated protein 33B-like [Centruroides sculpturatus]|uniref:vacuolar protein sorting-associated protein 33B-like n=1 Tax=Centruroides sculpturatus TaxID=218467 RepID=UPI000C6D752D|nr:vacuolar protein sorting-associated protein 33B-like [Centruroides sculpturatus]